MSEIEKYDPNFLIETGYGKDRDYYNPLEAPFRLYGGMHYGDNYARMPREIANTVNDGVKHLSQNAAGIRLRFVTDSASITFGVKYSSIGKMDHFALTGSGGFDVYGTEDDVDIYQGTMRIGWNTAENTLVEGLVRMSTGTKERVITINFPLYSTVSSLIIGLDKGSVLKAAPNYRIEKPVVYYGSSITQGGCASRPGNAYQSIISRMLDCNFINMGFSGSARGEQTIVDYMAGLDMSAFVLDYDHNAPTVEHLRNTHYNVYECIRRAHPSIPIIMASRPKYHLIPEELERLDVIRQSFARAVAAGDKNVYFIDGRQLVQPEWYECSTVDNCHPNDIGFACMAKKFSEVLNTALFAQ